MLANARAVSEPYRVHAHQQARDLVSFERASTPPLNSLFVPKTLAERGKAQNLQHIPRTPAKHGQIPEQHKAGSLLTSFSCVAPGNSLSLPRSFTMQPNTPLRFGYHAYRAPLDGKYVGRKEWVRDIQNCCGFPPELSRALRGLG